MSFVAPGPGHESTILFEAGGYDVVLIETVGVPTPPPPGLRRVGPPGTLVLLGHSVRGWVG